MPPEGVSLLAVARRPSRLFLPSEHLTQNLSTHIPPAQHDDALVIREAWTAGGELPPSRDRDAAGPFDDHVVRQHDVAHRLRDLGLAHENQLVDQIATIGERDRPGLDVARGG